MRFGEEKSFFSTSKKVEDFSSRYENDADHG